jgi:hypothetical protein
MSTKPYEDINSALVNSAETCVAMEMDETNLGFSRLRLLRCNNVAILKMCKKVGKSLYLSSQLCKSMFIGIYSQQRDDKHNDTTIKMSHVIDYRLQYKAFISMLTMT